MVEWQPRRKEQVNSNLVSLSWITKEKSIWKNDNRGHREFQFRLDFWSHPTPTAGHPPLLPSSQTNGELEQLLNISDRSEAAGWIKKKTQERKCFLGTKENRGGGGGRKKKPERRR
jgi:hypothetical protein